MKMKKNLLIVLAVLSAIIVEAQQLRDRRSPA